MSITNKVAIAVGFTATLVTVLLWLALQLLMAPRFEQLEIEKAEENFERAQNAVVRELLQLSAYRRDYGVWNDAYEFITGDYPEFLGDQVPLSLLPELNVNLVLYLDSRGLLLDGVAIEPSTGAAAGIDDYLPEGFASWRAFQAVLRSSDEVETIISTKSGYMLAAYAPVTRTNGGGAFSGHLLIGRLIDDEFIKTLRAQTRVDIMLSPLGAEESSPAARTPSIVRKESAVVVSAPLYGFDGAPILELSAITPAKITAIGRDTVNSVFMAVLVSIATGVIVVIFLIDVYVAGPIKRLTKIILAADKAPLDQRNSFARRNDEVGMLYKTYKSMFGRIEERTTELAVALRAAEAAEKAKTQFLANMSHEIRTPMNGVVGVAELLASTELDDKQRSLVSVIVRSGDALVTIINDILDFSKLDAGKTTLNEAPFNLRSAIDDIVMLFSARTSANDVELIVNIDAAVPEWVAGDVGRIRQILVNLIGNAIKFTREGHIRLAVSTPRQADGNDIVLQFALSDTGCGIAEDKLGVIFEKFSQADISSTRAHEGSGLGLAIAKSLVELMNGTISVKSTPGAGTTFWFDLALRRAEAPADGEMDSSAAAGGQPDVADLASDPGRGQGVDVLVAEDNEVNRMVVEYILKGAGYSYEMAVNGREAVDKFQQVRPRLVLMDISMPELNGLEATEEIRRIETQEGSAPTPIIGVSAHAMASDRENCLASGMDGFMAKPVSPNRLAEKIARHLKRADSNVA